MPAGRRRAEANGRAAAPAAGGARLMRDHDALYRSILANPADNTPRLVYADWLEENGRAEEAEFIRIESRLDTITPDDPDLSGLLDRQEELRIWLTAHVPGPEVKLAAGLRIERRADWWQATHRGFPQFLEVEGYSLGGAKSIRSVAGALESAFARLPTRWLVTRFITLDHLAELVKQPVLGRLEHLTIQLHITDDPQDEACRLIADSPHLGGLLGLVLTFPIGDGGAAALASAEHLASLKSLTLDQCNWCTATALRHLGSTGWFRALQALNLSELDDSAFEELGRLGPLPNLHTLELHEASFPTSSWRVFARSRAFPRLTRLVNGTEMAAGQMEALAAAEELRLAVLDLSACAIGNDGARALIQAGWIQSLRRLGLSFNLLTAAGFTAIANCRRLTSLKYLDLSYNTPGVRGLRALAANPALRGLTALRLNGSVDRVRGLAPAHFQDFLTRLDMPELRWLDLSNRPIGSRAAKVLAQEKFQNLRRLHLSHCRLTDTAMTALVDAPALQNLIELNASQNALSTSVAPLTNHRVMPWLSAANFSGNPIARDLARKLKRRPGCFVIPGVSQ